MDAAQIATGNLRHTQIDRAIAAASTEIERITRRNYIPITATKLFRWPQREGDSLVVYVREDLIAVTTLQTKAQDSSPTTISANDYFLEPNNYGPPYDRIEIDLSSTSAFEGGDTPQRSISVAGRWGYSEETKAAGTVSSGLASDATATEMVGDDGSLIDVGDTLLIESEAIFVSDVKSAALGSIQLNDTLTKDTSDVTVTVDASHGLAEGEIILIDSERMRIESIATNDLTVVRAVEGSVLAAHSTNAAINVYRTYTIVRAQNGTTGATHANSTAVSRYVPEPDVTNLCMALALANIHQEKAGWGRSIGGPEASQELSGRQLEALWKKVTGHLQRGRFAAV